MTEHTHALYIHWPWCKKKCPYCDFNSHVAKNAPEEAYVHALLQEMAQAAQLSAPYKVRSIFFGGGTPSLMSPITVARLIAGAKGLFGFTDDIEITLEANPTSTELAKFKEFSQAGVNRFSVGMQSLEATELAFLGREHSKNEAIQAVESALKVVDNVNLDLIYGLPNQTVELWQKNLEMLLGIGVPHISCYQLTIEKNTRFYADWRKGKLQPISTEAEAVFYAATNATLAKYGYHQYEVSNYAKLGYMCKHNAHIWRYGSYIGLGAGAHGRYVAKDGVRVATRNYKMPQKYIDTVLNCKSGQFEIEHISALEQVTEATLMGLRLEEGVPLGFLQSLYPRACEEVLNQEGIKTMQENGFLHLSNTHLRATPEGFKLLNSLLEAILQ